MILNIKIVDNKTAEKAMHEQMLLIGDLIRTKFGYLTIPEIKEAFKMYVAKEFKDLKVFRILDCIATGEILTAFTEFRNESLKIYQEKKRTMLEMPKEKSQQEIEQTRAVFLKIVFDEIKKNGYSSDAWLLHDETRHLHNISDDVRRRYYRIKEKNYFIDLKNEMLKNPLKVHFRAVYNRLANKANKGQTLTSVVNQCKSKAFCHFVKKSKIREFEEFKKLFEIK